MVTGHKHKFNTMNRAGTIWIVIGVVVLLFLAYFAFGNKDAEMVEERAAAQATSTAQAMDNAALRTQAQADLAALRVRAETGETYADLEDDFAGVRARLASAYATAEGETAEEWADISAGFDAFEASARAGTSNFLDSITSLISQFSTDVRVETESE